MTQERFDELVRLGRREERHARLLAEVALEDVSDSSIGELATRVSTSDEVRQVIRTESAGATEDVLDEVIEDLREQESSGASDASSEGPDPLD
jgi:hypothetical protein